MTRRVAIYARLSVTTEESVSIERQVEAGRQYAAARGWKVVMVAVDDGVSATKNRPEDRAGWREILEAGGGFDAVIVWKVDRLARRVLDFLHADEALKGRGAGIVAVEDPIDMTTAQGRAFATMLAVFGELEAAAISARVTAARQALVLAGRRAGGRPPFGFRNVPNPDGPGMVLAQDPERIDVVRGLVDRALAGDSLYALARWLEAEGVAPRSRAKRKHPGRWHEASVDAILRSPALAGLTPYRGDVVRDKDGLPVVDESVAIMSTEERRALLRVLDDRHRPGTRGYRGEPGLLSGLVRCGSCLGPMHRATSAGRYPYYRCQNRDCPLQVGISRPRVEGYVVAEYLRVAGGLKALVPGLQPEKPLALAEVEAAIDDTVRALARDGADVAALVDRLARLKDMRARVRESSEGSAPEPIATGRTFEEEWGAADDVRARRGFLASALAAVVVEPALRRGNEFDEGRVGLYWRGTPEAEALGLT